MPYGHNNKHILELSPLLLCFHVTPQGGWNVELDTIHCSIVCLNFSFQQWFRFKFVWMFAQRLWATICIWIPTGDLSQSWCLVAAGQCACAGLWPCLLLPYKVRVQRDTEERGGTEHHGGVIARLNPDATRCPRYPQLSTRQPAASTSLHSLWDMLQLANLTSYLLCPSLPQYCFYPVSAELNALFIPPFFSLAVSSGCVSCVCCVCSKAPISERYQADFSEP